MTTELSSHEVDRALAIRDRVIGWMHGQNSMSLHTGSPYHQYSSAMAAGVVDQAELKLMARWYAELWHYVGD